jgi:hypothetical protein
MKGIEQVSPTYLPIPYFHHMRQYIIGKQKMKTFEICNKEIDDTDSERQQKLQDLKKRDIEMDQFINSFEDSKAKEMETLGKLETDILALMEKITRNHQLSTALPEYVLDFS